MRCESFAPITAADSRILILGSMPGVKSLEMQEYYAHPQNRFWKLLALLLDETLPGDYASKKALLLRHRFALWDTLGRCDREGSMDSDIKNEHPNDIAGLLTELPQLQAVVCNGGKAGASFKKNFVGKIPAQIAVYYLHSTSLANARMDLKALAQEWRVILPHLR